MKKIVVTALILAVTNLPCVLPSLAQSSTPPGTRVPQPAAPEAPADLTAASPTFAITLAGGGARGAAHVGVLKVLEANGLKPDFVAGSSVGAVIGGLYSAGVPVSELERIVVNGELTKAFFPRPFQLQAATSVPGYIAKRMLFMKPHFSIYNGKGIARLIERHVSPERRNIENFPIKFAAITTNLLDTRPVWLTKGNAAEAVRASASLPFIYKPVKLNDTELIDGGVRENLPTEVADAAGAPLVVAVKLHSTLEAQRPEKFRNILGFADRVVSIMIAEIEAAAVSDASVLIEPDLGDMPLQAFNEEQLRKAVAAGEIAATKMLPEIRKQLSAVRNASAPKEVL